MAGDPNELIAQQFAAQRKALQGQKNQAIDELRAQSGRQQALTGMGGGSVLKAQEKAQRGLEQDFANQEQQIGAQEAAAKVQESQFARSQAQQAEQFGKQFGLSEKQFEESKNQFAQQYGLNLKQFDESQKQFDKQFQLATAEFNENKRTNIMNALVNLSKIDVPNQSWNNFMNQYANLSGQTVEGLGLKYLPGGFGE